MPLRNVQDLVVHENFYFSCIPVCIDSQRKIPMLVTVLLVTLSFTGSAAGMESLEKVWNLFFQFPNLEKYGTL